MSAAEADNLKRTPLFDLHLELGAKMVPFAGYEMPVQYPAGIKTEHLHTRAQAGLFDVSHMGQVVLRGDGCDRALETLVPVDLRSLPINKQTYAVFTNEQGGINDDLIITRWAEDCLFLVVNAACKSADVAHLRKHLSDIEIEELDDRALLALQGPAAREVMSKIAPEAAGLTFMNGCHINVDGADCYVTCSGYTGEDGFEISVPNDSAERLARRLLDERRVEPIGLGARDSLRLESGLCLYGHDMDETLSPVEAGLVWSISKSRRADGNNAGGFLGSEKVLEQLNSGVAQKRVGLRVQGKAPVREGAELVNQQGELVGRVTSGGFAPSLEAPIAMGYVQAELAQVGTELNAIVRGKPRAVVVSKMPFVPQNYHRG